MTHRALLLLFVLLEFTQAADWIRFEANPTLDKGKHIVFVTGDDEYKSEQSMPMMAHILAKHHGFDCTVTFAINRKTGVIDTNQRDNIPGLEALANADLMVIYTRFRELEDAQMGMIEAYLDSGKPVIGIRTSTHAFNFPERTETNYRHYDYANPTENFTGGFGKQVLGETWIRHWGHHGKQSSRGIFAPDQSNHPIFKGITDGEIWGPTDVYDATLPLPEGCQPLLLGEVCETMEEDSSPATTPGKNDPMRPIAWTWQRPTGEKGRVFNSTIGGAMAGKDDWANEGMRRMFVNACYWTLGLEAATPEKSEVTPTFEQNPFRRGVKPAEAYAKALAAQATATTGNHSFPGEVSDFHGYDLHTFKHDGVGIEVIAPKVPAEGKPWLWRSMFWKAIPRVWEADLKLVKEGYHVVIVHGHVHGHPSGNRNLDTAYDYLTKEHGFSDKLSMYAMSRANLSLYRWANANPNKVASIVSDNGVSNILSWPAGKVVPGNKSIGKGAPPSWEAIKKDFGYQSDAEALQSKESPIHMLKPLAEANVPILLVCGLNDAAVPYEENDKLMIETYRALGGSIEEITHKNGHSHGLKDPKPILDFIRKHTATGSENKTVLFYGNSMVERLLEHGELEARLQISNPTTSLKLRSLAWTGDEVGNRLRLEGYAKHMKKLIAEWPADTLVLGYGLLESFAGEEGLDNFRLHYQDHVRQLQQVHPSSELVFLSPIAIENGSEEENANLLLYTKAIHEIANQSNAAFIDLYNPTLKAYASSEVPLTNNGIHLNKAGNAMVAQIVSAALGGNAEVDPNHLIEVALAASAKHERVAEIVRPKNAVVYFGVRARQDEYDGEMPRYHEMIRLTEEVVHTLAAAPGKTFASMPVPTLAPMPPGKGRDDGPKTGIIKSVAENFAEFTVAEGYEVNIFASEEDFPELRNPVQVAFDNKGRLWVVTMPSFPHTVPGLTPPDKIIILEDTDRDGKADTCTPYLEGLDALDGVAFHHTGVVISEQPRLWLTQDTDGDSRSDSKTELLRGIDVTDSHHGGMINAGPMGDIIFSDGVFHRSQLETRFGVHRGIDATTYRLDPISGRINSEWQHTTPNPWDVDFDKWGHPYQMYGDGGVFDGTSLSWTPRGSYHPYGYALVASYGKGSGLAIVSSPNFADEHQEGFVSASLLGSYAVNLTTMDFESGMAKRTNHISLLSSPNAAFRPADLEFGMDGALYISDFCSPIIGHAQHPMRDPHWDHDFGRIWRIVHKAKPIVTDWPNIDGTAPTELAKLLAHPQQLVRHHARIELRKNSAKGLTAADAWLAELGSSNPNYLDAALEVVFTCAGLAEARPALIDHLLTSDSPLHRGAAIHTLRVQSDLYHNVTEHLAKVEDDPHPRVQNQLIGALIHLRANGDPNAEPLLEGIQPANKSVATTLASLDLGVAPIKERSVPVLTVDPKSELVHWLRYHPDGSGAPVPHSTSKPSGGGDHLYRTFVDLDEAQPAIIALNSKALEVKLNGKRVFFQNSLWSGDQQIPVRLTPGQNTIEVILLAGKRASKRLPPVFLYDPVGSALTGIRYPNDKEAIATTATAYDKEIAAKGDVLRIQAAAGLQFAPTELSVEADSEVTLVFENPDIMAHNFLLLKPGTGDAVGALADAMAADPTAVEKAYIPESDAVLVASSLVAPGSEETLEFTAPKEPGVYPYLCTFPGHWRIMKGAFTVIPAPADADQ